MGSHDVWVDWSAQRTIRLDLQSGGAKDRRVVVDVELVGELGQLGCQCFSAKTRGVVSDNKDVTKHWQRHARWVAAPPDELGQYQGLEPLARPG